MSYIESLLLSLVAFIFNIKDKELSEEEKQNLQRKFSDQDDWLKDSNKSVVTASVHDDNFKLFKQEDVSFMDVDEKYFKHLVYSFSFVEHERVEYNTQTATSIKVNFMKNEPISTTDRWLNYEQINGSQSIDDILNLIKINQKNISKLRGNPVISYLTAIDTFVSPNEIHIDDKDVKQFNSLIQDIPKDVTEIDVMLHSIGGYIESTSRIVQLLRKRFKKVNFLIPFKAYSSASMMCFSGDEIIMTPESALSPFDSYVESPDTKEHLPVEIMLRCAKEAKQAHNPFNIFYFKSMYPNWNKKMSIKAINYCLLSMYKERTYPAYWLGKYMFKDKLKHMPFGAWKLFTVNGRKATKITKKFLWYGKKLAHNTPIMSTELMDMGLNVSDADGELLYLMRETYTLVDNLFDRSIITKLYTSNDKNFFKYKSTQATEKKSGL